MSARIICHAAAPLISTLALTLGKNSSVDLKRWKWTQGCLEDMDILWWHGTFWNFLEQLWVCFGFSQNCTEPGKPESILPWTILLVSEPFQKPLGDWSFFNKNTHVRIVVMFGYPRKWRWCSDEVCVHIEHLFGALLNVCYKAVWTEGGLFPTV